MKQNRRKLREEFKKKKKNKKTFDKLSVVGCSKSWVTLTREILKVVKLERRPNSKDQKQLQ